MRILIVEDGWGSYILPAVRSLGGAGWAVGLAGPRRSRSASSRWVLRTHPVPPAESGLAAFAAGVDAAIKSGGYDMVFGGDDVEVLALSAVRDSIGAIFPYAKHESVLRSIDKLGLAHAAEGVGLATPRTVSATDRLPPSMSLPVFVKARLHWTPGSTTASGRLPVRLCLTEAEVAEALAAVDVAGGNAVVQEVIEGELVSVNAFCDQNGNVLAESHQVASRLSPRLRTPTRAQTIPVDGTLSAGVARLLADLGWFGIANLQFQRPADGGPLRLIDLNGRFYGTLALARAAGLDLPTWWVRAAAGEDLREYLSHPVHGCPGVRYQALEEDLRRARVERCGGLVRDITGTLSYATSSAHSTWDVRDPVPSVQRIRELVSRRI